ncbi:MAG: DUF4345 domain-containing protein [Bacteroidetes bacterium]|nr:MAG: DUF4345 domain-containing protein [Bacteroidota bacterium]
MKAIKISATVFLALMGLAFAKVGIEALTNPQAVLANVGIELNNSSALSSMRAVYGGMHLVFGLFCFWGAYKMRREALGLVTLYTIGFVVGRLSGVVADGAPNAFVSQWLVTESISLAIAAFLLFKLRKQE